MSGRATGWVLRHFPIPNGEAAAARTRKLVLLSIADAANVDGRHARPGIAAVMAEWNFSRATVLRSTGWLVENGWLEVTEKGTGRGHATEYRIVAMRSFEDAKKRSQDETVREPGKVSNREEKVSNQESLSLLLNGSNNGNESADAKTIARDVVKRVWETRKPKPVSPFVAAVKIVERLLGAGWSEPDIERAMNAVPTISVGWLEAELRKQQPKAQAVDTDRTKAAGKVKL